MTPTGAAPASFAMSRRSSKAVWTRRQRRAASIIVDQFDARAMWPMTDAEAVLFIMTVALLVALAQVAG